MELVRLKVFRIRRAERASIHRNQTCSTGALYLLLVQIKLKVIRMADRILAVALGQDAICRRRWREIEVW